MKFLSNFGTVGSRRGQREKDLKTYDELRQEIEALRNRLSKLSEASVRVSESLDVNTVLHEVVGSARALTGARYGVIVTIDESGKPQDFVFSGLTSDEYRRLTEWTDAQRLFSHLQDPAWTTSSP